MLHALIPWNYVMTPSAKLRSARFVTRDRFRGIRGSNDELLVLMTCKESHSRDYNYDTWPHNHSVRPRNRPGYTTF